MLFQLNGYTFIVAVVFFGLLFAGVLILFGCHVCRKSKTDNYAAEVENSAELQGTIFITYHSFTARSILMHFRQT